MTTTNHISEKLFPTKDYNIDINTLNYRPFIGRNRIEVNFNKFGFLHVLNLLSIASGGIENLITMIDSVKDRHKIIQDNDEKSLIKSLSVLSAFSKNNIVGSTNVFHDGTWGVPTNYPRFQLFDLMVQVDLKWNDENVYKAGHYFEYSDAYKTSDGSKVTVGKLLGELKAIISFLISEKMISNKKD